MAKVPNAVQKLPKLRPPE